MFDWMAADLAAVDRRRTPWVLAAGHRPMYCAALHGGSGGCSEEAEAARRGIPSTCPNNNPAACRPLRPEGGGPTFPIEELFHRHGVDLAVSPLQRRLVHASLAAAGPWKRRSRGVAPQPV